MGEREPRQLVPAIQAVPAPPPTRLVDDGGGEREDDNPGGQEVFSERHFELPEAEGLPWHPCAVPAPAVTQPVPGGLRRSVRHNNHTPLAFTAVYLAAAPVYGGATAGAAITSWGAADGRLRTATTPTGAAFLKSLPVVFALKSRRNAHHCLPHAPKLQSSWIMTAKCRHFSEPGPVLLSPSTAAPCSMTATRADSIDKSRSNSATCSTSWTTPPPPWAARRSRSDWAN